MGSSESHALFFGRYQLHLAMRAVELQPVTLRTVLYIKVALQPRPLAQALADFAADAVGRPHDAPPLERGRQLQRRLDMLHPVVAVKGFGRRLVTFSSAVTVDDG